MEYYAGFASDQFLIQQFYDMKSGEIPAFLFYPSTIQKNLLRLQTWNIFSRYGHDILTQNDKIRKFTGFNASLLLFFKVGVGRPKGHSSQSFFSGKGILYLEPSFRILFS